MEINKDCVILHPNELLDDKILFTCLFADRIIFTESFYEPFKANVKDRVRKLLYKTRVPTLWDRHYKLRAETEK